VNRACRLGVLLLAMCRALPVAAHDRTVSYSTWEIDGPKARVTARIALLDVSRLPWASAAGADVDGQLGSYLSGRLTLQADGQPCPLTSGPTRLPTSADRVELSWEVTCPSTHALELRSEVLLDVAPTHLHLARVHVAGQPTAERVLSDAERTWLIGDTAPQAAAGGSPSHFLVLGLSHILTAYGTIAFLVGLLLVGGTLRDAVRIVVGFTIAHSITLGLAVFAVLRPDRASIEALIGLSVALVAAENLWITGGRRPVVRWMVPAALLILAGAAVRGRGAVPALTLAGLALFVASYFGLLARAGKPAALRAGLAFLFGLVHGFGFAGAMRAVELPSERMAEALFGFNAGVELGQVALVLVFWSLFQLLFGDRDGRSYRAAVDYGSAAILAVGVFLFVSRSHG